MRRALKPVRMGCAGVLVLVSVVGCTNNPSPTAPPSPTRPPVALGPAEVHGIGDVAQGKVSGSDLVLRFTEASAAAIGAGAGALQVTLTDHAGRSDTLQLTGTPAVVGPGSLGASASFSATNVLTVSVVDSDSFNIEQLTVSGLGIRALPAAALGSISAVISCTGSLAGCAATAVLTPPGNVVAAK